MKQRVSVVLAVLSLAVGFGVASPLRAEAGPPVPSVLVVATASGLCTTDPASPTPQPCVLSLGTEMFQAFADGKGIRADWAVSGTGLSVVTKGKDAGSVTITSGASGSVRATYRGVTTTVQVQANA